MNYIMQTSCSHRELHSATVLDDTPSVLITGVLQKACFVMMHIFDAVMTAHGHHHNSTSKMGRRAAQITSVSYAQLSFTANSKQ